MKCFTLKDTNSDCLPSPCFVLCSYVLSMPFQRNCPYCSILNRTVLFILGSEAITPANYTIQCFTQTVEDVHRPLLLGTCQFSCPICVVSLPLSYTHIYIYISDCFSKMAGHNSGFMLMRHGSLLAPQSIR